MADTYNKTEISQELLYAARLAVRANRTSHFDGVLPEKAYDDNDPLTRRACILYVKAEFGLDNPDAEKYRASFESLKKHLSLSSEYVGG